MVTMTMMTNEGKEEQAEYSDELAWLGKHAEAESKSRGVMERCKATLAAMQVLLSIPLKNVVILPTPSMLAGIILGYVMVKHAFPPLLHFLCSRGSSLLPACLYNSAQNLDARRMSLLVKVSADHGSEATAISRLET
jgi:hypothetical protein